ncbi:MAG: hypothetical protein IJK98_12715 [Clostridia bacterium]|nr:hypothetical protein [Clostridia bacterium]
MSRNEKISFAPKGVNSRNNRVPKQIWLIAAAAVVFGLLSFLVILAANGFDFSLALGKRQETAPAEESTTEDAGDVSALQELTDAVNFLAVCADEKELTFCMVVSVRPAEALVRIKPVSPDFVLETDGEKLRLADLYSRGSIADITDGFARKSIPVAKYVTVTEDNFISLLQKLGPVEITLEKGFEFTDDAIRYTYSAGPVSMSAEAVLSYMKNAAAGDELLRLQAQTAAAILRTYFTEANVDRGEDFFAELINLVNSDISVFDYTPAVGALKALAAKGLSISVIS